MMIRPLKSISGSISAHRFSPDSSVIRFTGRVDGRGWRSALWLLCACLLFQSSAMADPADDLYQKAARKYHELYSDAPFGEQADHWLITIRQFQTIYHDYPDHPRAPQSLYNIARLYRSLFGLNRESIYLDRSNLTYRKLVQEYPDSNLADDAQWQLAENYERYRGDLNLAALEYEYLLEQFPDSQLAPGAREKLARLRPRQPSIQIRPSPGQAVRPTDLSEARFGGLTEAEIARDPTLVAVSKVDYWSTAEWSRLVVNAGQAVRYRYQVLGATPTHPWQRMVVDITPARLIPDFEQNIGTDDGLVSAARVAQFDPETVRIALDVVSLKQVKVFHFALPNQYKVVVDMVGGGEVDSGPATAAVPTGPELTLPDRSRPIPEDPDPFVSISRAFGLKVKRIVLDPGHGGKDPGASANGLVEKDITLNLAFALRRIIQQQNPEVEVLLTRTKDVYMRLEERTAFANQHRADLFISIHVNASLRPRIRGVETYFLSLTTDNDALRLAAAENQTSLKAISDLQSILHDLLTSSKIRESSDLAEKLQSAVVVATAGGDHRLRDLGVKKAPFIVLLGAQMPAALIEVGFLTNEDDARNLRDDGYRLLIAQGMFQGIRDYMN